MPTQRIGQTQAFEEAWQASGTEQAREAIDEDREDCFLEVFEEAIARFAMVAQEAASGESTWRGRVRAGLAGLLLFAGDEPVLGALVVRDALSAGPNVLTARPRVLDPLTAFVDQGRDETKTGRGLPPLTAEGTVGAVLAVVYMRMLDRDRRPLIELLNPLMSMIVLSLFGEGRSSERAHTTCPQGCSRAQNAATRASP